jgi:hypothetical protein
MTAGVEIPWCISEVVGHHLDNISSKRPYFITLQHYRRLAASLTTYCIAVAFSPCLCKNRMTTVRTIKSNAETRRGGPRGSSFQMDLRRAGLLRSILVKWFLAIKLQYWARPFDTAIEADRSNSLSPPLMMQDERFGCCTRTVFSFQKQKSRKKRLKAQDWRNTRGCVLMRVLRFWSISVDGIVGV